MLFKTLKKLVQKNGLTEEIRNKIDTLYALSRLTDEEYRELISW